MSSEKAINWLKIDTFLTVTLVLVIDMQFIWQKQKSWNEDTTTSNGNNKREQKSEKNDSKLGAIEDVYPNIFSIS